MVSIDEAYVDMTGTERLHGPPLQGSASAAPGDEDKRRSLNCSIGIGDVAADREGLLPTRPSRTACCGYLPAAKARSWLRWMCERFPASARCWRRIFSDIGIRRCRRSGGARRKRFWSSDFGKWGLALAGKSHGEDAGGWFDADSWRATTIRSRSATSTRSTKTPPMLDRLAIDADAVERDGGPAPARGRILRAHHPAQTALQRFHHDHAGAVAGAADADGSRDLSSRRGGCFCATGRSGGMRCRLLGVQTSNFRGRAEHSSICWSPRAMV